KAGLRRKLRDRHVRSLRRERLDHEQAARQRGHEVGIAGEDIEVGRGNGAVDPTAPIQIGVYRSGGRNRGEGARRGRVQAGGNGSCNGTAQGGGSHHESLLRTSEGLVDSRSIYYDKRTRETAQPSLADAHGWRTSRDDSPQVMI